MTALTANVDALLERCSNLWIHVNEQVLLLRKFLVAVGDFGANPSSKCIAHERICHVDEPLAGYLMHVTVIRQETADPRVLLCLLKDAFDAQVLILRDVEHLDIVTFDATRVLDINLITYYLRLPEIRSLRK